MADKTSETITALIMAGGRGARFWPLSREDRPKQFLRLDGNKSLLLRACERAAALTGGERPYLSVGADQRELARETLGELYDEGRVIAEPLARNTAAAVYWSALHLRAAGKEGVVAVFPADHQIDDDERFLATLKHGCDVCAQERCIVVIGIRPRYPATGYGYIERGHRETLAEGGEFFRVRRFVEKPYREKARRYLKKGTYLWNSGIIIFPLPEIFAVFDRCLPEFSGCFEQAAKFDDAQAEQAAREAFAKLPSVSFDVGVLEKEKTVCVVESAFDWDDVGSYNSLGSLITPDSEGNICLGSVTCKDVKNSVIVGDNRLIAMIGLRDIVVVEDRGVLLICPRRRVEEVREIVAGLQSENSDLL